MSRVTPEEVKKLVDTDLDNCVIQVWIDSASCVVDSISDCVGDNSKLTSIELYLSAHLVAMLDPETRGYVTKEKTKDLETTYSDVSEVKNSIDNTIYGMTANMLSNGCLANTSDRATSFCAV